MTCWSSKLDSLHKYYIQLCLKKIKIIFYVFFVTFLIIGGRRVYPIPNKNQMKKKIYTLVIWGWGCVWGS